MATKERSREERDRLSSSPGKEQRGGMQNPNREQEQRQSRERERSGNDTGRKSGNDRGTERRR